MTNKSKRLLNELDELLDNNKKEETIFVIKRIHKFKALEDKEEGVEINEGYTFELNSPLPELADGIAKFAKELPNQNIGEGSDKYFIQLINEYFNRISSTDVK